MVVVAAEAAAAVAEEAFPGIMSDSAILETAVELQVVVGAAVAAVVGASSTTWVVVAAATDSGRTGSKGANLGDGKG